MRLRILLLFLFAAPFAWGQTYTAASCNQSDVNAVINGPTHTAVDGDTIIIPSGDCSWTSSGITVPSHIGITITGTGTPNGGASTIGASSSCTATQITWTVSSNHMFTFQPEYGNSVSRLSCMEIITTGSGSSLANPVNIQATCTSSGCPLFRGDNLTIPTGAAGSFSDASFFVSNNPWGVFDHNTPGDTASGNGLDLVNVVASSWLGVGSWGDESWAQPDTLGTEEAIYLENNLFTNAFGTDVDNSTGGGGRFVCRFNVFNSITQAGACGNHGTESTGRARGGRQSESYENIGTCTNTSQGCDSFLGLRSGVFMDWGEQLTAETGSWFNEFVNVGVFRASSLDFPPWSGQGFGPWDTAAGQTQTSTFTLSGVSGTCTYGSCTLTASSQSWTTNQYAPGSSYYDIYDVTTQALAGIASNTATTLTLSWCGGNAASCYANFNSGDTVLIMGRTIDASGTYSGTTGSTSFIDSTQSWTTNQWVNSSGSPYVLADTTQGWACEIGSNTSDTITCATGPVPNWANQSIHAEWTNGDNYIIIQTQAYLDQESRYGGTDFTSSGCGSSAALPTCIGSANQTLDPGYEWDDSHTGSFNHNPVGGNSAVLIRNRDFYYETLGQTAQTSATSPFDGTTTIGVGHGTLTNRPTTCTTGVAYFATDQGNWNQSGGSNPTSYSGQGELFKCTATNTWTESYEPYTYPHPLDVASGTYTITISSITGNGTVTSSDSVINCTTGTTGTCTDSTASGTVTLTATPSTGYTFTGWGGGTCSGTGTCSVTTTATVTATFTAASNGSTDPHLLMARRQVYATSVGR